MIDRQNSQFFAFRDHASLWFSLGVGLLVMQVGAYLIPSMGTRSAFFAIVIGSLVGSALLAWVAHLGSDHGMSSSGLMQQTLGRHFAKLPIALNVLQLLGWTAFELVVMRDGVSAMAGMTHHWFPHVATIFLGIILYLLASSSMVQLVRKFIGRFGLPLIILSLLWLTIQFILKIGALPEGFAGFWNRPGTGDMSLISAIDLVMAMPISWLPLVADYSRYNKIDADRHGAFKGTWVGYAMANMWCYGLGILVVSVAEPGAGFMSTLLLAQFGLIALGLILVDEIDNAYGDVHSGAVSLNHLIPKRSVVAWGKLMVVVAVVAAIFLPVLSLEPFLLILSSVFVPLFGVIVAWLSFGGKETVALVHWPLVAIWMFGIAVSHGARLYWPVLGQAIPSLVATMLMTALYRQWNKR